MSDSRRQYIEYVQNVLGVKNIVMDPVDRAQTGAVTQIPLLVLVENFQTYNQAEVDLLQKMLSALKIDSAKYAVVDLAAAAAFRGDIYLQLTDSGEASEVLLVAVSSPSSATSSPQSAHSTPHLVTYSARKLLQNGALKKQAWAEMQKIISYFQSSN